MAGRPGRDAAFPLFDQISQKFKISPGRKATSLQLLAVVDDALLCWSPEDGCLLSQVLDVPATIVQVGIDWRGWAHLIGFYRIFIPSGGSYD